MLNLAILAPVDLACEVEPNKTQSSNALVDDSIYAFGPQKCGKPIKMSANPPERMGKAAKEKLELQVCYDALPKAANFAQFLPWNLLLTAHCCLHTPSCNLLWPRGCTIKRRPLGPCWSKSSLVPLPFGPTERIVSLTFMLKQTLLSPANSFSQTSIPYCASKADCISHKSAQDGCAM